MGRFRHWRPQRWHKPLYVRRGEPHRLHESGCELVCNGNSVSYTYDAEGRRVKKSSGTNYWYGPGGQALAETDNSGAWTNYIFFGGQRLARNVSGDIKYYITDHLHSTAMFVDKAGTPTAILDDNDMYPWGGIVPGVGKSTSNNAVKFTGKYRDTESQLDYFGVRYYSNGIGRFMSPDWAAKPTTVPYAKFGDPQSLNLYSYTENSPINKIDLDSHSVIALNDGNPGFNSGPMHNYINCSGQGECTSSPYEDNSAQSRGETASFHAQLTNPGPGSVNQAPAQNQSQAQTQQVTITYDKNVPPMQPQTQQYVEKTAAAAGVESINISATTNGEHAPNSNHYNGTAVDINKVNGGRVVNAGKDPSVAADVRSIQNAANNPKNGVAHENYGPVGGS